MLIAPSGPTCWSGTRVPGRPLLVACCSSSSTLREVIVGVVSGLSGRVVGSAPPGATPSGAVCGRFWLSVAPPSSCPARPASPCAAPAVPHPSAPPPPAGVAPVGAARAPGLALRAQDIDDRFIDLDEVERDLVAGRGLSFDLGPARSRPRQP